ncbi:MAG: type II toxin-antitoxin system HicB family antitoxin [Planctomycetaceae bacterium]|nr:type II toxin-antitoxin system HicB family antitoxin [Planctomycetaceae bacterium]
MMKFDVILLEDARGGFIALCPSMPQCKARARSREAALQSLRNAIRNFLAPVLRISPELLSLNVSEQGAAAAGSSTRAAA